MGNAVLLQSGSLRDFQPLGADGNPVYQAAPQLRAAIKRKLGAEVADLFAIPQRSEDGNRIDWYAPREGPVVPWSSATPEEQSQAKAHLFAARERINETGRLMQSEEGSEHQVFGRLLEHVTSIPNEGHVQLVDGRPVLSFWGFLERGAQPGHDVLSLLPVMQPHTSDISAATAGRVDAEGERNFRWWWIWLPLLLLWLALLMFWLLRGCTPSGGLPGGSPPDLGLPTTLEIVAPDVGRLPMVGDTLPVDIGVNSPELVNPDLRTGELTPIKDVSQEVPAEETVIDEAPAEPPPNEKAVGEEAPVEVSPVEPAAEEQLPSEPLVIPPDAVKSGNTDFLNGRWSTDSGLMDRNGRPVDVEYEFNQGKGVARYRRSNGIVCEGPTSAAMSSGQLVITDSDNIVCQDGVRFRKSRVECDVGEGGLANCAGNYTTGDSFSVEMNKAANQ